MMFTEEIRQLREKLQMLQRQLAAVLEIAEQSINK